MGIKGKFEKYVEGIVWRYVNVISHALRESEPTTPWLPTIKVTLDEGAKLPVRAHDTDAGADLCCREGVTIAPGDSALVDTGVHVELPRGTTGMLKSKSGLNCMQAMTTTGVIDEGYTGPIKVRVYNHGAFPKELRAGDKVTQLVVMPVAYPTYERAEEISGGERGDSGFGSSGK